MLEVVEDSDAELLACVRDRERDPKGAARAQAAFYRRHVRYLYGALVRKENRLLELAGMSAEDLVQETFHKAFDKAHTFQADEDADPDRARARTRAWLGRIAHHLLADQLTRMREISATPYLERLSCDGIDEPSAPSAELDLVTEGLSQLSEREQDVLRVTALYLRAGEHQRLPNAVSAELAQRWKTTNENIRAIRSRALKKLKDYVTEHAAVQEAP